MAGTILLVRKPDTEIEIFQSAVEKIQKGVSDSLAPYFQEVSTLHTDDHFLLMLRHDSFPKFFQSNTGDWIAYEGQIFDLSEEKRLSAEELYQRYQEQGSDFINRIDGHFVIKQYDVQQNSIIISNDFIKNKTNFICETDEFFLFTPFAQVSAAITEAKIDICAFNEYMWRYYILSQRSILEGVEKLKPASQYIINQNQALERRVYWRWPKSYTSMSFDKCVTLMVEKIKATSRLLSKSYKGVCSDFTMGQDSRQNIAGFTSQGLPLHTMTFGKPSFEEVQAIKRISKKHCIPHEVITLNEDYTSHLFTHFERACRLGSCEEPGHLLGRILYMREKQSDLGEVLLNGMDGHFYKNGLWDELYTFNLYRTPKKFNIGRFLNLRALSKNYQDDIFSDRLIQIKSESRNYFTEMATEAISGYENSPVSIQVDQFDLYHWLNFGIAANSTCNLITNSISPMLLRRNLELALSIPVRWKFNLSRWQRAFVDQLDPKLAAEPTDFGGVNMTPKSPLSYIPFIIRYFYHQSGRLRKKIVSIIGMNVQSHLQEAWDYGELYRSLYSSPEFGVLCLGEHLISQNILNAEAWSSYKSQFDVKSDKSLSEFEYMFKIMTIEKFLKNCDLFIE